MTMFPRCPFLGLLALLLLAAQADAQQVPHVGYVYPAGGQRGTTFEVIVGGQYLDGVDAVHVSGTGIEATVVDHDKPLNQRQINQVREKIQETMKQQREEGEPRRFMSRRRGMEELVEKAGISKEDFEKFEAFRKMRNDPKIQPNPQIEEKVSVRFTVDKDAAIGIRDLRLATSRGLSNPIRFCIGGLPETLENEPNDKVADSVIDALPVVANGQILPGDVDRFAFKAQAGQRLVVAVSARELIPYLADAVPGWFQATLALYDSTGSEVAYVDDFQFHPDPVLFFEIPKDDTYTLEIKDSVYRGREDFVYRIAIGEIPFLTSVFPLGGHDGQETQVVLQGWNLPVQTMTLRPSDFLSIPSQHHAGGRLPFAVGTLPEALEQEPNNRQEEASKIDWPAVVNGRIDQSGDWDLFCFEGHKGDRIVAEVLARRLGSPCDSVLELTDADGKQLAFSDDYEDKAAGLTTHHADSRVALELPADGVYYLRLGDAQQAGGRAYGYRLRLAQEEPDFELRLVPATVNLRGGGTVPVTVYALRRDGFSGEIHLALKDAPGGMILDGGRIPAGQDRIRMTLTAPVFFLKPIVSLRLQGTAIIDGKEVCREAVSAEDMMQAFIYQHLVPADELLVSIQGGPRRTPPVRRLDSRQVELTVGGTALARFSSLPDPMGGRFQFTLSDPPEGIAIDRVEEGADTTLLVLRADGDQVEPGLEGNLIVDVSLERQLPAREGPARRIPVGSLPAIPFQTVKPHTWLDAAQR